MLGNSGGNQDGNGSDNGSQSGGDGNGSPSSSGDNQDSTGSQGGESGGKASGSFAERGLSAHNKFRKVHGAPEMKLDEEMTKSAEEYAKKIAQMGTLKHSSSDERSGNGENLAMKCSSREEDEMSAEEATKNWSVFCTWPCVAALFLDLVMF